MASGGFDDQRPYFNQGLFSSQFIDVRLRDEPQWTALDDVTVKDVLDKVAAVRRNFEKKYARSTPNESKTREDLITPILRCLGFDHYSVEDTTQLGDPDYTLFSDEKTQRAFLQTDLKKSALTRFKTAAALCEAKRYGRDLDVRGSTRLDTDPNKIPMTQIAHYLSSTGVMWGILTNGIKWRLLCREADRGSYDYYEFDLDQFFTAQPALGAPLPTELFRYFLLFFHRSAYEPSPDGKTPLDHLRLGSIRHGTEISSRLRHVVFEEVLPAIGAGFLAARKRHGIRKETQESLEEMYGAAMLLMYRLLFILHAEARHLLPMEHAAYLKRSLRTLCERILVAKADPNEVFDDDRCQYYQELITLFDRIDVGDAKRNLPRYNGGLFSKDHPSAAYLKTYEIDDSRLAAALDSLYRDKSKPADEQRYDYSSIKERELGTLYEGMLEFRFHVATEEMFSVVRKSREKLLPKSELSEKERQLQLFPAFKVGELYLSNDRQDRKVTGAFYTPDFIVRYIVEATLAPLANQIEDDYKLSKLVLESDAAALDQLYSDWRASRLAANRIEWKPGASLQQKRKMLVDGFLDPPSRLLALRVVDPAMGSGHFVAQCVDYLSDRVFRLLSAFPLSPVVAQVEVQKQAILDAAKAAEIVVDEKQLSPQNLIKRMVMKRCVYGVDLNPMAVELAKLSLWLGAFTVGAPLSYLDHHFKCGNSLIGTWTGALDLAVKASSRGQRSVFGDPLAGLGDAVKAMITVSEIMDATITEIEESKLAFQLAERAAAPFREVLDVWASQWFGNRRAQVVGHLERVGRDLTQFPPEILGRAEEAAHEHRMFHWEVEFPEVWFGRGAERGFDAVVGNPPYVRNESIGKSVKQWLTDSFAAFDGGADLYVYFVERSLALLRDNGRLGFIVSNKWLKTDYGEKLRTLLATQTAPSEIVDFGHSPIFEGADTFTCIPILTKAKPHAPLWVSRIPRDELDRAILRETVERLAYEVPLSRLRPEGWILEPPEIGDLMDKIEANGIPFREFAQTRAYRGLMTGLNDAYVVDTETAKRLTDQHPSLKKHIRKFFRGSEVTRWSVDWRGEWIIALRSSENHEWPWSAMSQTDAEQCFKRQFRALYDHFAQFKKDLQKRTDQGSYWWELRSCDYWEMFDAPKIVYSDVTWTAEFALDSSGALCVNTNYFLPTADPLVLAVLNSPLFWWYSWRAAQHGKDEALRMFSGYIENCRIPNCNQVITDAIRERAASLVDNSRSIRTRELRFVNWIEAQFGISPEVTLRLWREGTGAAVEEYLIAKRRVRSQGLEDLRTEAEELHEALTPLVADRGRLEREVAGLVMLAFGLTSREQRFVEETMPPRAPLAVLGAGTSEIPARYRSLVPREGELLPRRVPERSRRAATRDEKGKNT